LKIETWVYRIDALYAVWAHKRPYDTLLGVRHACFDDFPHKMTSWIEVEWLVGIFTKEYPELM